MVYSVCFKSKCPVHKWVEGCLNETISCVDGIKAFYLSRANTKVVAIKVSLKELGRVHAYKNMLVLKLPNLWEQRVLSNILFKGGGKW